MTTSPLKDPTLAELRSAIDRAAQLYYTVGGDESRLSNEEYDLLLDALRDQCPDDHRLTRVGAPYSADELRNKVEHTIPMGSLNNTDGGIDGFAEWYRWVVAQCDGGLPPLNLSLKMDGSSVAAYYENGELQCVVGRGNGEVGENLTANAVKWRHLPTSLPRGFTGVVRGEAMLYNEDFDTVNQENGTPPEEISNPRNVGNGIMGRTDGKQNQYIRYVAFNMVGDKIDLVRLAACDPLGEPVVPGVVAGGEPALGLRPAAAPARTGLALGGLGERDGLVVRQIGQQGTEGSDGRGGGRDLHCADLLCGGRIAPASTGAGGADRPATDL